MGEVVDPELVLETVLGETGGDGHDSGVADEYVQPGALGEEGVAARLNGRERGLIAWEEGNAWRRRGVFGYGSPGGFGLVDDSIGGGGIAAGEVDVGWRVGDEAKDGLFA